MQFASRTNAEEGGRGKRRELILDTRGTCFLCLEETDSFKTELDLKDVCLRNICRYLKINQSEVLLKSLNLNSTAGGNQNKAAFTPDTREGSNCDFSVLLCPQCASLTQELSQLIRNMEMIHVLMGQHLQTFQQILALSQEETSAGTFIPMNRLVKLQQKLMTAGGGENSAVETQLVTHLRRETIQKCLAKVTQLQNTCVPRVCLERCDIPTQKPVSSSGSILPNNLCNLEESGGKLDRDHVRNLVASYSRKSKRRGRFMCTVCEKGIAHNVNLATHLINNHPEKFFLNCKLPHVSEAKLKNLCNSVMSLETNIPHDDASNNLTRKLQGTLKCVHCPYKSRRMIEMRHHLSMNHYNILQEKIIKIQQDNHSPIHPSIQKDEASFRFLPSRNRRHAVWKSNSEWRRLNNGQPLTAIKRKRSLQLIKRQQLKCPRQKNQGSKKTVWKCEDDDKMGGCGRLFSTKGGLTAHKIEACPVRKQRIVWACFDDDKGEGCGRTFSTRRAVSRHKKTACHMRSQGTVSKWHAADDGALAPCLLPAARVQPNPICDGHKQLD